MGAIQQLIACHWATHKSWGNYKPAIHIDMHRWEASEVKQIKAQLGHMFCKIAQVMHTRNFAITSFQFQTFILRIF